MSDVVIRLQIVTPRLTSALTTITRSSGRSNQEKTGGGAMPTSCSSRSTEHHRRHRTPETWSRSLSASSWMALGALGPSKGIAPVSRGTGTSARRES